MHKTGLLFKSKVPLQETLAWTKGDIKSAMTMGLPKTAKKPALESFRLIQAYMGDRKASKGVCVFSVWAEAAGRSPVNVSPL